LPTLALACSFRGFLFGLNLGNASRAPAPLTIAPLPTLAERSGDYQRRLTTLILSLPASSGLSGVNKESRQNAAVPIRVRKTRLTCAAVASLASAIKSGGGLEDLGSRVTTGHLLLAVAPSLPIHSIADLIEHAKKNPGKHARLLADLLRRRVTVITTRGLAQAPTKPAFAARVGLRPCTIWVTHRQWSRSRVARCLQANEHSTRAERALQSIRRNEQVQADMGQVQ
jgi:hypothetical protein